MNFFHGDILKKISFIVSICLFLIGQVRAAESYPFPNVSFEIKAEKASEKIRDVVLNPETFLLNYEPAGAKISGKKVNNAQIQFYATKKVLISTQKIFIKGFITSNESDKSCPKNAKGYTATMDFSGSDDVIYENFEKIELVICATEKASNLLSASVSGKIVKGNNYKALTGKFVKDMIIQQVNPLIAAIKMTVEKY